MLDRPSHKHSQHISNLLARTNVGTRLGLGFATVLGIALAGAMTGMAIGDRYEQQSRQALEQTLSERKIVFRAKARTHHASIFQRDMVYLLNDPDVLIESIRKFRDATALVATDFALLEEAYSDSFNRLPEELDAYSKVEKDYRSIAQPYFKNVETLLGRLETLETASDPADLEIAQSLLLEAGTNPSFMGGHMFADTLQELDDVIDVKVAQSVTSLESTARLRRRIILLSLLISVAIASALVYIISQSIVQPLQSVGEVAQRVTEEERFDLKAPVTTQDEVATVATALNQLIERVQSLITDKEVRAQELEQANETLMSTQKKMIAQEKLASLGSLTAGIAHEIKNPLNFVSNFSEIIVELVNELEEELERNKEQMSDDFFSDITTIIGQIKTLSTKTHHHSNRADSIVANMLQHSRSGESEWTIVDINHLVEEAISLAYHGMRAKQPAFKLEFDNDYDSTVPHIKVSHQDLSRVFINIASNACYAIYQKQLEAGADFCPLLKVRTRHQNERIAIHIRDNGLGMSSEVKDKVFDQFFTTKPTGEGTGLGLSLSYNIVVEQHQGRLEVESEEGIYTDFIVTLPVP